MAYDRQRTYRKMEMEGIISALSFLIQVLDLRNKRGERVCNFIENNSISKEILGVEYRISHTDINNIHGALRIISDCLKEKVYEICRNEETEEALEKMQDEKDE